MPVSRIYPNVDDPYSNECYACGTDHSVYYVLMNDTGKKPLCNQCAKHQSEWTPLARVLSYGLGAVEHKLTQAEVKTIFDAMLRIHG